MELKNIKHGEIERVKVYYEGIHKLVHGLQIPTIDNFLTNVFWAKWTQKHPKQHHHVMQSSPHHDCKRKNEPMRFNLTIGHKCNVLDQEPRMRRLNLVCNTY
jgi:hypothetical protein